VQGIVAVTLIAELGDRSRWAHPRARMRALGCTPSESSSGERRRHGRLTQAGNPFARRARIAGAGAYRSPAKVRRPLPWRLAQLPQAIQHLGWTAQGRLWKRGRDRTARGKQAHQVVVAIAREMAAFIWAIARELQMTREAPRPRRAPPS
jgi:hypothetical protein